MAEEEAKEHGDVQPIIVRDLQMLPRWARVAFAARCARRVQPLFRDEWPSAPQEHVKAIDNAITISEKSAAAAVLAVLAADAANGVAAISAARAAVGDAVLYADAFAVAAFVADTADRAIRAAARAATAPARGTFVPSVDASTAARYACAAAGTAFADAAVRRDYELLIAASEAEKWSDDTPVPPEFFGPLWPDGEPEDWPTREPDSAGLQLMVEIELPDDVELDEDRIGEISAEIADRLDDLHRAYGGDGLTVDRVELDAPAFTPQEVPT